MIFSARTLPGTGADPAGAAAARRVATWAGVWPVIAVLAAPAARRGRRVVLFFAEIICGTGQTHLGLNWGYLRRRGTCQGPLWMPLGCSLG